MIEVTESQSQHYSTRTYANAKSADWTIALAADLSTAGERCTAKAAGSRLNGYEITLQTDPVDLARMVYGFLKANNVKVLNIAGNGIYTLKEHGIEQDWANLFLYRFLKPLHEHLKFDKVISGGQTGVDTAGVVAAEVLGIPAMVHMPYGYIQRHEDKVDRQQSKAEAEKYFKKWVMDLEWRVK